MNEDKYIPYWEQGSVKTIFYPCLSAFIYGQIIINQTAVMHVAQVTAHQSFVAIEAAQDFSSAIYDLAAAYHAKARLALWRQHEHSRNAAAFHDGRGRYQ